MSTYYFITIFDILSWLAHSHFLPRLQDTVIDSVEIWNMVIENTGSPGGLSCEDVAKNNTTPIPGQSIFCKDDGICTKIDPCKISCKEINDNMNLPSYIDSHDDNKGNESSTEQGDHKPHQLCGDNMWGSCQYSCKQSKIRSELMSDGLCHETGKDTRDCHIDACGRFDPCRVPFVVHTILLFSGATTSLWNKRSEELFVESFALTVNVQRIAVQDQLFGPGDVKVLSATDYYDDDNLYRREPDGMKVVVEISIFNPNAVLPEMEFVKEESDINLVNAANFTPNWKDKVSNIVHKVEDMFHDMEGLPLASCNVTDIYPLSKTASDVHIELTRTGFMEALLEKMQSRSASSAKISPFTPLFNNRDFHVESKVLTSWTIKTEVDLFSENAPLRIFTKDSLTSNWKTFTTVAAFLFAICYCGVFCGTCCTRRRMRKVEKALESSMKLVENLKRNNRNNEKEKGKYSKVSLDGDDLELGDEDEIGFQDEPISEELELPDMKTRMSRLSSEQEK